MHCQGVSAKLIAWAAVQDAEVLHCSHLIKFADTP
jgi:hypothetical protein